MHAAEDVDLVFVNGNIYTVNERQPHAEAIVIHGELASSLSVRMNRRPRSKNNVSSSGDPLVDCAVGR